MKNVKMNGRNMNAYEIGKTAVMHMAEVTNHEKLEAISPEVIKSINFGWIAVFMDLSTEKYEIDICPRKRSRRVAPFKSRKRLHSLNDAFKVINEMGNSLDLVGVTEDGEIVLIMKRTPDGWMIQTTELDYQTTRIMQQELDQLARAA